MPVAVIGLHLLYRLEKTKVRHSVKWYWEKWQPKEWPEGSGKFSDSDIALRKALDEWGVENGMGEVEVVKDETPVEEIIEATTAAVTVETEDDNVPF